MKISNILESLKNPKDFVIGLARHGFFNWIPTKTYLKMFYFIHTGKRLNYKNPRRFNEKIQVLKYLDRNKNLSMYVDKYEVRNYVTEILGSEYLFPIYGIYESFDDIDFSTLPNQFVIKSTNGSGGNILVKDKNTLNFNFVRNEVKKWLKKDWFHFTREYPYKNVKTRILIEKFMIDTKSKQLQDFKFFCFNGCPKLMYVASDRGISTKIDFFNMEMERLNISQAYPNGGDIDLDMEKIEKMIELSKQISKNFKHIRVDFYLVDDKIYFGELTFYHFSGVAAFVPDEFDFIIGDFLNISELSSNGK